MGYLELAKQVEQRMVMEKIPSHDATPQPDKKSVWRAFRYADGRPAPLSNEEVVEKTHGNIFSKNSYA